MLALHRSMPIDDVTGRTLTGRALTYGKPYRVSDDGGRSFYREGWRVRALEASIEASRNVFELRAVHADVRAGLVSFEDGPTELRFRATLDETELGEAVLGDVEAAGLPAVSINFRPRRNTRGDDGTLWRVRADLRELSLTDRGQYPDARVLIKRDTGGLITPDVSEVLAKVERALIYCADIGH